ncbi:hypothetical protein KC356_g332 [Hortaea werneckii]|nr:hypothetical protein KC356_g332 [Hortaea werneckii]
MSRLARHLRSAIYILRLQELAGGPLAKLHHLLRSIHILEQVVATSQPVTVDATANSEDRVVRLHVLVDLTKGSFSGVALADDHQSLHAEVRGDDTAHHARKEARMLTDLDLESLDSPLRHLLVRLVVKERAQPEKVLGADTVRRWLSVVHGVLSPDENIRLIGRSREETELGFIPEKSDLSFLQALGELEPLAIESCFVKVNQAGNEEGVVVCEAVCLPGTFSVDSAESRIGLIEQVVLHAGHSPVCCLKIGLGLQAIPGCDNLVIERRSRPVLVTNVPVLRAYFHLLFTQDLFELVHRPDIESAFLLMIVLCSRLRVLRHIVNHLQHEVRLGHKVGIQEERQELCVVVKHLLEVWQTPISRHRISCEAVPYLVLDAALGHAFQRLDCHVARVPYLVVAYNVSHGLIVRTKPQQCFQVYWRRELGCAAKAAVLLVKPALVMLIRLIQQIQFKTIFTFAGPAICSAAQCAFLRELFKLSSDMLAAASPRPPPPPLVACKKSMYCLSMSGRSSRSILIGIKFSLSSCAMRGSSKLSWAITWHQWHAEYPMLTNSNLLVLFASCSVSGDHSCHAVGLSMCDRTYGLLLSPQQLDSETCLSFAMVVKGSCWTSVRPGVLPGVATATVGLAPLAPVAGMSTLLASRQLLIRVWLEFVDLARRRMISPVVLAFAIQSSYVKAPGWRWVLHHLTADDDIPRPPLPPPLSLALSTQINKGAAVGTAHMRRHKNFKSTVQIDKSTKCTKHMQLQCRDQTRQAESNGKPNLLKEPPKSSLKPIAKLRVMRVLIVHITIDRPAVMEDVELASEAESLRAAVNAAWACGSTEPPLR